MLGTRSRGLIDVQRKVGLPLPKTGESRGGFTEEVVFNQPRRLHMGQASRRNGRWLAGGKMQCGEAMRCGSKQGGAMVPLGEGLKGLILIPKAERIKLDGRGGTRPPFYLGRLLWLRREWTQVGGTGQRSTMNSEPQAGGR